MKKLGKGALPAIILFLVIWLVIAPPRFWVNLTRGVDLDDPIAAGKTVAEKYNCSSCHKIGEEGRTFGPDLNGVTRRLRPEIVDTWLRAPRSMNSDTAMPDFNLSDSEITALVAYLTALDEKK